MISILFTCVTVALFFAWVVLISTDVDINVEIVIWHGSALFWTCVFGGLTLLTMVAGV